MHSVLNESELETYVQQSDIERISDCIKLNNNNSDALTSNDDKGPGSAEHINYCTALVH